MPAAPSRISSSATIPTGGMNLIVGPNGPVLTLSQPATGPGGCLYHRLSRAEAARLADDLAAWAAWREPRDEG